MLRAASEVIKRGKLTVLLLPGIGTHKELEIAFGVWCESQLGSATPCR